MLSRGQTSVDIDLSAIPTTTHAESIRYWFDNDSKSLSTSTLLNGSYTIDVSSLLDGLHTIHYQIVDNNGMAASPYSAVFMKMTQTTESQGTAATLSYWFDDQSSVTTTSTVNGLMTLDVSSLLDGLHTIHYQIINKDGERSHIASAVFMKMNSIVNNNGETVTAKKLVYWFDDETESQNMDMADGVQMLDASHLLDGMHTLHYQVICSDGTITSTYSAIFMRMDVDIDDTVIAAKSLRYWFDDSKDVNTSEMLSGNHLLDVSTLHDGLHTIHYQVVDINGSVGSITSSIFMKMNMTKTEAPTSAKKQRFWFDNDKSTLLETDIAEGTQMLDASQLLMGLHTIHYQLVDEDGSVTTPYTALFMKVDNEKSDGKSEIISYMYWLNDNSSNNKKVKLDTPTHSYQLISLLPMHKESVRSSSFQFETKDGEPKIYAKNDLHIRFEDAAGYWADDSRSFVDYSVSESLTDLSDLQTSQTFNRPDINKIKWFKFDAAPGDTIAFRSSQATSLQVFAPSGKEIYSTMGDKSVVYGGAHTWEEGTYYVAVHDVTGSRPSITLDYMHMDRFDVVDQDVRVVGNGGCSTITFQGNGFNSLYSVDLKDSKGNIIVSENIGHESDAKTSVRFNFTNIPLGCYDAVFHFTEDDKIIKSLVEIEDAKKIEIQLETSYASTFLRGTANTYTIRITNTGNSTAYQVPLKLQLQADGGIKDISSINMSDNIPVIIPSFMEEDSVPQNIKEEIQHIIDSYDGMLHFMKFRDTSGDEFMEGYFALDLPPNRTYELSVTIKSSSRVILFTQIPSSWFFYAYNENSQNKAKRVLRESTFRDNACCSREHVECIVDVVVNGLDFASLGFPNLSLASCLASLGNTVFKTSYDIWCGEAPNKDAFGTGSFISGLVATAASCLPDRLDPQKWAAAYRFFYDIFSTGYSCATTLSPNITSDSKCPPDPPKPHPSTPVNSLDPNDIYGYLAPSGSKFIGEEVINIPYRIEFENDTTFATASAHTVIVKDTLDASKFDLASYKPTSIKIGDKDVQLNGNKTFVTTVDMRPAINTIAQVEGLYDAQKGIATWKFTSLDPMTMEETDDVMQGFLPVNFDGSGIGEVAFNIDRLANLADGTEINNKASIVFDSNDAIETPVWTNIIDAVPPISGVSKVEQMNDSIVRVHLDGYDKRSGTWKYALYVQYGKNTSWNQICETDTTCYDFRFYDNIDYGFCVVATDSAGNVEKKIIQRECSFVNGEDIVTEVITPSKETEVTINKAYDLSGRLIQEEGYRGVIIKNRKKSLRR